MQLQFSLLSKKGLRYLLYPFISLWIVGGRISPSFTSALSKEFSNNLRKKCGKKRTGEDTESHRWCFYLTSLLVFLFFLSLSIYSFRFYQIQLSSLYVTAHTNKGSQLSSVANLSNVSKWKDEARDLNGNTERENEWQHTRTHVRKCILSKIFVSPFLKTLWSVGSLLAFVPGVGDMGWGWGDRNTQCTAHQEACSVCGSGCISSEALCGKTSRGKILFGTCSDVRVVKRRQIWPCTLVTAVPSGPLYIYI